jgi:hypothetical protein
MITRSFSSQHRNLRRPSILGEQGRQALWYILIGVLLGLLAFYHVELEGRRADARAAGHSAAVADWADGR